MRFFIKLQHKILIMKRAYFIFLGIVFCCTLQVANAQYEHGSQVGQRRGYIPPPKDNPETSVILLDPYEETNIILPKCVEEFKLDAFEKEILKTILLKNFKNQNGILNDKKNSSDERQKKLVELNKNFYKELSSILTVEEIEIYKLMDFKESKEEKKKKKKDKRKKRKT